MGRTLEVAEINEKRIVLRTGGFSVAFINALRRLALSDVPTMAVDFVYIYDNTSPVYDEMVAHRLGLLVLKSDEVLGKYRPPEDCAGKEPSEVEGCYTTIRLEASTGERESRYVTAKELDIEDPDLEPAYPETPILYLGPSQNISLIAYARLGRGREHSKWSPASISALRYTPIVEYDSSKASEECLKCLEHYPQVREALSRGGKGALVLEGVKRTSALKYCAETACEGALIVRYDSNRLELEVESTGALKPERIILEASRILDEKVKRFAEAVSSAGVEEV
ncbi:MAG: DNA-directed RNA polymerase subunit D [Desulfurococcales archaeon]|nr:DNA-directed RNA polymerase subunit D [Desulfurococcales archaeon]